MASKNHGKNQDKMPKKEKVIVTGGAGFVGSNLVDALVREGYDVHIIDNLIAGKMANVNPRATFHKTDINDLAALKPIFRGARCVFHLAALPRVQFSIENPTTTSQTNVQGTLNILVAAREAGVKRVVYSATSSAYGDQKKMPLVETMPVMPKSPYGLQKYMAELYCKMWSEIFGLETVCLRYFNVYGPKSDPNGAYALVISKFLAMRQRGEAMTITGDGKQKRDFTHVYDVVRANIAAMKSTKVGKGESINIGAGNSKSVNEIAKLIGGPVKYIPARFEPKNTLADNRLAKKLLGWTPKVSIEEGIAELKEIAGV